MGKSPRRKRRARPESSPSWSADAARLGLAVRVRRKTLGLTQYELARFAGCGVAFLYELETGKPTLRLGKLLDVLHVLGLSLRLERGKAPLAIASELDGASTTP